MIRAHTVEQVRQAEAALMARVKSLGLRDPRLASLLARIEQGNSDMKNDRYDVAAKLANEGSKRTKSDATSPEEEIPEEPQAPAPDQDLAVEGMKGVPPTNHTGVQPTAAVAPPGVGPSIAERTAPQ